MTTGPGRGPWPNVHALLGGGLAVLYAVAVVIGRMSRLPGTSLALVWPAAAVGFVWLLWASFRGRGFLLANAATLALLAAAINWATGAKPLVALALGLANVLQAVLECWVLTRIRPQTWQLRRSMDLAAWVVACTLGAAVSALLGPLVLSAASGTSFWPLAGAWTLRNASNTFVFGALALRWAAPRRTSRLNPHQALELVAAAVVLSAAYGLVFGYADGQPLAYLVLPLSMWISLRFSTTIAAAFVLLSAVLVMGFTMAGHGPFAAITPTTRVLLAQAFVTVVGLVTLVLALHRDERQELIDALREATAVADDQSRQLQKASRHKSEFLTTMSHEIRTPLNGVLGFTALLAESPRDPAAAEWASAADTAGRLLLGIVNDGLDLAKIEAGGVHLESIELDLLAVAREALLPSQLPAQEKGIDLRLLVGDGLACARRGDPVRLRQIMTNLVANAVKFTPAGSVGLALDGQDDALRIRVIDTGIGMTAQQQAQLFVPFQQASADTTRLYGGTGLGLTIAEGLVQAMGGRITVASQPDEGTVFTVELELPRTSGRITESPITPLGALGAVGALGAPGEEDPSLVSGMRVLVAEDNHTNQLVARAMLQARGLIVEIVDDGEPAVAAALSGEYDAVFMDCQMPTLNGLDATRRIRAGGSRIPIIAMTAGAFDDDRQACLEAGMDDFLPKPWKKQQLTDVLSRPGRPAPARLPRGSGS